MALSSIFKKASSLFGFSSTNLKPPPLDGEIIYCKNNVCVHPPATLTSDKEEHHQGYLTIRSTSDKVNGPSLILTWIPNSTLRKNTKSIENSPNRSQGTTPKTSPLRRTPRQEFAKPDGNITTPSTSITSNSPLECCMSFGSEFGNPNKHKKYSLESTNSEVSYLSTGMSPDSDEQRGMVKSDNYEECIDAFSYGDSIKNNQKVIGAQIKDMKIGQHVNNIYAKNLSKINNDISNLTKAAMEGEAQSDVVKENVEDEQSVSETQTMKLKGKLLKKTKIRTDSGRSVSIEMEGDNLIVVTEDLVDDVIVDNKDGTGNSCHENNGETGSLEIEQNGFNENAELQNSPQVDTNFSSNWMTNEDHVNYKLVSNMTSSTDAHTSSGISVPSHPQSLNLSAINTSLTGNIECNHITTPDISVTRLRNSSGSSTTTSGPDSEPPSPCSSSPNSTAWEPNINLDTPPSSSDSMAHNLQFPENSLNKNRLEKEKKSAKEQVCGVFSVDLGQMRSLRVFYSNLENTTGQIVIASRESQYKILHFHHGGLDKLAEIFQDWSLFATSHEKPTSDPEKQYKQFMIVKPQLTDDQCHPEEGIYSVVTEDIWQTHMMDDGVIEDDFQLRKAIFFGGVDPGLRHEAWPFLLHYFPFDSTFEEREHIRNDKYIDYQNIRKKRESQSETEREEFWRNVQCTVEKDVVRTDRSHPYFKGENNPNIEVLKSILLNYAVANPSFGYTQGMSDLLAPVLAEVQHEVDAYWCFVGLMQRTIFVSSPKDCDMDWQLSYLRELLRLMTLSFYKHLCTLGDDALELLFAHRWILLCFKREFNEKEALRIWEACWSHYQTDYFHLFICVAIVSIYGEDVVEQQLPADEILLHFSSLACHMSGELVLRKARGLLHEYRRKPVIPCTLHGLCSLCGQGMWDSGHVPTVECTGNHLNAECPYLSPKQSPS